ncbi:hypothetical protein PAXRUDRAFT_831020 [Paxillus rubicundulus Ve08.2h10]|uniref:Protein BIG1 n=1 Tax=Paxillus rubicundulus Ve08.2h10 TaxID=930991 RepID=A0A0D0D3Z3_9AGAM|nr:hypothetical protein PAXRUDRAFT_831020 [Paxillus rubicundulus Ve08.2h10]
MRLSILPILLAGVAVVSQVSAEPIRVVVETTSNENANIRLGHELANANVNGNDDNVAHIVRPTIIMTTSTEVKSNGRHFCGASLREKALRLSNAFRHAMGLPIIEADPHTDAVIGKPDGNVNHHGVHILPVPFVPTAVDEKLTETLPDGTVVPIFYNHPVGKQRGKHHGGHHHGAHTPPHHGHRKHKGSFLRRIHRAIMALGPWEGRAVAFVLGCGIGVLLRMFWVLTVLAYRTVRGEREEEETFDHEYIMYEPETLFVAPPEYTDEKVRLAEFEAHNEVRVCN